MDRASARSGAVGSPRGRGVAWGGADLDLGAITGPFTQPERSFQRQVITYAEIMGWRWYHVPDSRRSTAGFPDLVLIRRPLVLWVELKSERGRLKPDQKVWLDDLRACGQVVYVWRPSDWPMVEKVLR